MDDQRLKNRVARIADVVRTHQKIFGDIRPATSMVEVSKLITPEILVESRKGLASDDQDGDFS